MLGLSPNMLFEIAPRPARPRRLEYTIPLPLILPVRKDILTTMAMTITQFQLRDRPGEIVAPPEWINLFA
jgi:hypothetical protein